MEMGYGTTRESLNMIPAIAIVAEVLQKNSGIIDREREHENQLPACFEGLTLVGRGSVPVISANGVTNGIQGVRSLSK